MRRCFVLLVLSSLLWSCTTPSIVATQSIQLGDAMNNASKYKEAIAHYEKYLEVSPSLGLYRNPSMEADVCRKLAHAYSTQGKYRGALNYLKRALGTDSTISTNALKVIEDYRQIGLVNGYTGDYHEAIRYLNKSLTLNEGMERSAKDVKRMSIADTYISLDQINLTLGNYKEARFFADQALSIYTSIPGEFAGVIEAKLILGIVAREKGLLDEAVKLNMESKQLAKENQMSISRQDQALGEIYFLKGEFEEGIRYKISAVEQAEKSNIKPQIVISYMRLGDGYRQLGDEKKARAFYQQALFIQSQMEKDTLGFAPSFNLRFGDVQKAYDYYIKAGSSIGSALVSLRLGEMRFQENDLDSALILFARARGFFEKSGSNEGIAKSNIELAKTHTAQNNLTEPMSLLREAKRLSVQPDLHWQIFFRMGIVFERKEAFDSALNSYQKAIRIIDEMRGNLSLEEFKTIFANTKVEVYDRLIMLLLRSNQKLNGLTPESAARMAFEFNEQSRSRTFLDMLGNRKIDPKSSDDAELVESEQLHRLKIQQITRELNKTNSEGNNPTQLNNELQLTRESYNHLIQKIKLNNPAYATVANISPTSLADVRSSMDDKTVIVEYWISKDDLVIWVVDKRSATHEVVRISEKDLVREIARCRNSITSQLTDVSRESLKKLGSLLIEPVKKRIGGFTNLVIVPHKNLHFVPFQALLTADGQYLVNQYNLSYAPSSAIWYYCMKAPVHKGTKFLGLALGDLEIGQHDPLPGTETEITQLSKLYPDFKGRTDQEFTESLFKQEAENYNYVHIATHGVFNSRQPLYSYLLMSESQTDDGHLTVDEIFGMEINAKFVTLSACETGLGEISKGDELEGLSRAFIYAGTPGVVVSLWKVDDASTAWMMGRFHQYINAGVEGSLSLTFAQRDFIQQKFAVADRSKGMTTPAFDPQIILAMKERNNSTSSDPYYWAPFIFIGNGTIK